MHAEVWMFLDNLILSLRLPSTAFGNFFLMALYEGGYEAGYSSSTSSVVLWQEESLLESYRPLTSEFTFMGVKAFKSCCNNRARDFADGSWYCNEYILFTGVSVEHMATVDKVRKSLPKMRCQYDAGEQVLIVKLMVGVGHETSMETFSFIFTDKLRDLGHRDKMDYTKSARFGDGRRQKEAEESFKPAETRRDIDAWPSLVFEMGFFESLAQLRNDARFWLTRSELQCNIVIILHIDKVQRQIQIERWEVIPIQRAHGNSVQYPPNIGCCQRILLKEGDVYTGPSLQLSIDKVFDIVPPNVVAGDLDFTAPDLQAWQASFWSRFP